MRRNGRVLIVAGVALALVAAVLAVVVLSGGGGSKSNSNTTADNKPKDVIVVQAKKDIPAHSLIAEGDLEEVKVDADAASPDAVRSIGEVIGFAYNTDLAKGQRLLQPNLEEPGLANELTPGKRAISLPVDKNNLVGGLLREDDRIDITYTIRMSMIPILPMEPVEGTGSVQLQGDATLAPYGQPSGPTYPYPGEAGSRFWVTDVEDGEPTAKVVLQDIKVLRVVNADSAGGSSASNGGDYIVLEIDPAQMELVQLMLNTGKYQVSLRNSGDTAQVATDGMDYKDLVMKMGFPIPSTVRLPGPGAQ